MRTNPKSRRTPLRALLGLCLLTVSAPQASPQAQASREYDIKAAFLYNFVKYVDLPSRSGATITIGILGTDPSGGSFDIINGKVVAGRTLAVRHLGSRLDPRAVNILFVSDSEHSRLRQIFGTLGRAGVLTVGETKGFAQSGGMINFITESNKVRFEINPDAAARANVRISSQLLRLARVVHE